jgi:hypothetical protein
MKKKFSIFSFVLTFAVLFSMLFESLHKYEHIAAQLAEVECVHDKASTAEITHQHHHFEFCGVCAHKLSTFTFSFHTAFDLVVLDHYAKTADFESKEITQFFKGSLFALRGPPTV